MKFYSSASSCIFAPRYLARKSAPTPAIRERKRRLRRTIVDSGSFGVFNGASSRGHRDFLHQTGMPMAALYRRSSRPNRVSRRRTQVFRIGLTGPVNLRSLRMERNQSRRSWKPRSILTILS